MMSSFELKKLLIYFHILTLILIHAFILIAVVQYFHYHHCFIVSETFLYNKLAALFPQNEIIISYQPISVHYSI